MSDYREVHEQARAAGVARRNETRHERAIRRELEVVKEAIEMLPATCKYHGSKLERERSTYWHGDGSCCDTGKPALARRKAEDALARLQA